MKSILILRHAKSDWSNPELSDFERPLAKRGLKDAPRMGSVLKNNNCIPDIVLASPARRIKQTVELVTGACGYKTTIHWEESFYGGTHYDLITALKKLPNHFTRPLVVGHNPEVEETIVELLSLRKVGSDHGFTIRVPTAGLICLDADIESWSQLKPGRCVLQWFLIPKLVKAIQ
jgi:phosphohistidine phosphatase